MAFSSILNMWDKWNIRGFVILSFSLQVFLTLFARIRKQTADNRLISLLWLAYLMANWVASFAFGLISYNQGNLSVSAAKVEEALQAFWASFLLLHFGGTDSITAFSLDECKILLRHLLSFILQVDVACYIFLKLFSNNTFLMIPTMLVFIAACIKNIERLLVLDMSSLSKLKIWVLYQHNSSSFEHHELVEELNLLGDRYSGDEEAKLAESIVVRHGYYFFQIIKVFLADLIFTCQQREMSHKYFCKVSALDALRIISVELQFMYEVLHTKVLAIRPMWSHIFRFIAFVNIVMACVLFNHSKKNHLPELDVKITNALLFGAIALDMMAPVMLIFSDWTVGTIKGHMTGSSTSYSFLQKLVSATDDLRKPRFTTCKVEPNSNIIYMALDTPIIFRRWSETISACNLLSESLKESPRKMCKCNRLWSIVAFFNIHRFPFGMSKIISCFCQVRETITGASSLRNTKRMILKTKYMSKSPFIKELWIFIFKEVRHLSENADDLTKVKKIFEARGDLFLKSSPEGIDCENLLVYVTEANYDTSIIIWHLATEMWYNREKSLMSPLDKNDEREFSKILSDYMLYLILNQPDVMSTVIGIAQITLAEMVCELRALISGATMGVEGLCKILFEDSSEAKYRNIFSKSVFSQGVHLAKDLESLGEMKWKVLSGVWVEMLSYAAIHTKGEVHVQVLGKGGELLTFVWLLMAHFGCLYNPEWGMYKELR